jgi:hypothetical protein
MIYERNSELYLLGTFGNDHDTNETAPYWQYSLYAARRPWGPWRRIFTNDYNGLMNRAAQDMRYQGGTGYDVHLLAAPVEAEEVDGVLKVRLWLSLANWTPYSPPILYGRTGPQLADLRTWRAPTPTDPFGCVALFFVGSFREIALHFTL